MLKCFISCSCFSYSLEIRLVVQCGWGGGGVGGTGPWTKEMRLDISNFSDKCFHPCHVDGSALLHSCWSITDIFHFETHAIFLDVASFFPNIVCPSNWAWSVQRLDAVAGVTRCRKSTGHKRCRWCYKTYLAWTDMWWYPVLQQCYCDSLSSQSFLSRCVQEPLPPECLLPFDGWSTTRMNRRTENTCFYFNFAFEWFEIVSFPSVSIFAIFAFHPTSEGIHACIIWFFLLGESTDMKNLRQECVIIFPPGFLQTHSDGGYRKKDN